MLTVTSMANRLASWPFGRQPVQMRLDTANAIKAKTGGDEPVLPSGMKVVYPYDTTPFIKVAIRRSGQDAFRGDPAGLPGHVSLPGKYSGHPDSDHCCTGGHSGDLCGPGAFRVLHQHADHVRDGVGHRPPRGRRDCGGGKRGTYHA